MATKSRPIEGLAVGAVVAIVIAVYSYVLYNVPSTPRVEIAGQSTGRNVSLLSVLGYVTHPIRVALPHAHIPFIPVAYVLSTLYTIAYPLLVILHFLFYIVTSPLRLVLYLARLLYPFYVFFGVAALVGLAVGGSFAGIARLVWFLSDAKG